MTITIKRPLLVLCQVKQYSTITALPGLTRSRVDRYYYTWCYSATLHPLISAHHKMAWFAGRSSSAPAHFHIFKGTGWSVSNPWSALSHQLRLTLMPSSPYVLFTHSLHFTTHTIKQQFHFTIVLSSIMHSYKSLAVLALAVSTASTAYSAPLQYAHAF